MKLPEKIQRDIESIQSDHVSGAVSLTARAAAILIHLTENKKYATPSRLIPILTATAKTLPTAQPAMASIYNLSHKIVATIKKTKKGTDIGKTVRFAATEFMRQFVQNNLTVARHASSLIKPGATVLTHSYSSTVLQALLLAKSKGKKFRVICTESRPMQEGVQLAKALSKKGISVTLIVDSAISAILAEVRFILVGADSISPGGLVNKIGTSGLALYAREFNIPFYTLCCSNKFLAVDRFSSLKQRRNPKEILPKRISRIRPANFTFDVTPLKNITSVISEMGIITVKDLSQELKRLKNQITL